MIEQHLPGPLIVANFLVAGMSLQLALTQLVMWRCRQSDRVAMWLGLSAASVAAALLGNLWLIKAVPSQIDDVVIVRAILIAAVFALQVPTVAAFAGQRVPRIGLTVLVTLLAVRVWLMISTDLVYAHSVGIDGAPQYGPLVALTSLPALALLLFLVFRMASRWDDRVERTAFTAGIAVSVAFLFALFSMSGSPAGELLAGFLVFPCIASLQVIATRRTARAEHAARRRAAHEAAVTEELARSERRSSLALRAGGMGWYEWAPDTRRLFASPEFAELLGIRSDEIPPTIDALLDYVHAEDRLRIGAAIDSTVNVGHEAETFRVVRADGVPVWIEANGRSVRGPDGRVEVLGVVRDITERKIAESELTYMATHDALTGLANRTALTRVVSETLARREAFALIVMDLDGFKDINATLGHPVGDQVLVAVARRVESVLRPWDVFTRIGGDEFALVITDRVGLAEQVAARILAALKAPIDVDGVAITVRASIGIVDAPSDGTDAHTLLRRADAAMYRAKARGGGIYRHAEDDDLSAARRLQLAGQLQEALITGQIEQHYQPTIDISSGQCSVLEALARWRHPELGLVGPSEFVPLAEQYGLGPALARHVLSLALATCAGWRNDGLADAIAVNVSPDTLVDPDFAGHVATALAHARLPGSALVVELTEDSFARDTPELLAALTRLRDLGVRLAIDDFGTGYSSLSYLAHMPIEAVKLDRVFAAGLSSDGANDAIVEMSIELAHRLGFRVIAEGVETPEALAALGRYGCDGAQGFHICRPAPAEDITAWLVHNQCSRPADAP